MRWEKPKCLMLRALGCRSASAACWIRTAFGTTTRALDATAQRNLPTAVCTVYDPRYPDPLWRRMGSLGLSVINDVVTREAFSRNLSLIDLRVMFDADEVRRSDRAVSPGRHEAGRAIHRFASTAHRETRVIR